MLSGGLVGRPCSFPFVLADCSVGNPDQPEKSFWCETFEQTYGLEYVNECTLFWSPNAKWCATKTYANNSRYPNEWGYCSSQCKGQFPSKERPEHLAVPSSDNLWETRIFNLGSYLAGHCHTYTPNETHYVGGYGHLYAYGLKDFRDVVSIGWKIYVHSQQVIKGLGSGNMI